MSYRKTQLLKISESFEADITINNITDRSTFDVIKDRTKDLLGKITAKALRVLHIELGINTIETFPKLKDILVDLPINRNWYTM